MNKNKKDRYILAIDQGTTSTRAILYNTDFIPVAKKQTEIKQFFPREGWVEHDPMEIWKSVLYGPYGPWIQISNVNMDHTVHGYIFTM